jgi:iron(III) transport system ATP-binding protein
VLGTHDREEAFSLADRVALMLDGSIVQTGRPEDVYLNPSDRWSAAFAGAANFVRGRLAGGIVETPVGVFPAANGNGAHEVEALIRPELLELEPDPAGVAKVVGREFRGHDVFYRLRLRDGTTLISQRPSTEVVPLGTTVSLRPHQAPVPVFS